MIGDKKMVKIYPGESREDFVKRYLPIVLEDEMVDNDDQATMLCYDLWEEYKNSNDVEYKEFNFSPVETKEDDSYHYIYGYGAAVGNVDKGGDLIESGAFKSTFEYVDQGGVINANWMHDSRQPVGVWEIVREDDKGLFVKGKLPKDDRDVKEKVMPQVKVGSLRLSIGYNLIEKEFKGGVRYLKDIRIFEISFVGNAMNDKAVITDFKSLDIENLKDMSERDMEKNFKSGFKASNQTSKFLVKLIKEHYKREAGDAQREVVFNEFDKIILNNYSEKLKSITKSLKYKE
jgi:HK97 family phage prohead protease